MPEKFFSNMCDSNDVAVMLSTYNGSKFVEELLESIVSQDFNAFHVLVQDDLSTDDTLEKVRSFSKRKPGHISIIENNGLRLGASRNFATLLQKTSSKYVMFCDQDDVWLPNKIEETFARMQEAEANYGVDTPILIHTDLKVVDRSLDTISDSFWSYQNIHPQGRETLNRLLTQNVVTGCTVMINASLRDLALPIPEQAIMHDWWLALVAAAFGQIEHLDKATILYRQHGQNKIGAMQWKFGSNIKKIVIGQKYMKNSLLRTQTQAKAFLDLYSAQLSPEQHHLVSTYSSLQQISKPRRLYKLLKHKYFKAGFFRTLAFFARI